MKRKDPIIDALLKLDGLDAGTEPLPSHRLDAIRDQLSKSLEPVRPLPSNGTLALLAVICFLVFACLATIPVGFAGYDHLSLSQKLAYYAVILLSAVLLSIASIQEVIPGSKRLLPPMLAIFLPIAATAFVAWVLFPTPDFHRFVHLGLPCLRLGTICAALSGVIAYLVLRNGFSTSPIRSAATGGLLAGLAGFAVLALHCPQQNAAHILVWHSGAMLIASSAGALLALARMRQQSW